MADNSNILSFFSDTNTSSSSLDILSTVSDAVTLTGNGTGFIAIGPRPSS